MQFLPVLTFAPKPAMPVSDEDLSIIRSANAADFLALLCAQQSEGCAPEAILSDPAIRGDEAAAPSEGEGGGARDMPALPECGGPEGADPRVGAQKHGKMADPPPQVSDAERAGTAPPDALIAEGQPFDFRAESDPGPGQPVFVGAEGLALLWFAGGRTNAVPVGSASERKGEQAGPGGGDEARDFLSARHSIRSDPLPDPDGASPAQQLHAEASSLQPERDEGQAAECDATDPETLPGRDRLPPRAIGNEAGAATAVPGKGGSSQESAQRLVAALPGRPLWQDRSALPQPGPPAPAQNRPGDQAGALRESSAPGPASPWQVAFDIDAADDRAVQPTLLQRAAPPQGLETADLPAGDTGRADVSRSVEPQDPVQADPDGKTTEATGSGQLTLKAAVPIGPLLALTPAGAKAELALGHVPKVPVVSALPEDGPPDALSVLTRTELSVTGSASPAAQVIWGRGQAGSDPAPVRPAFYSPIAAEVFPPLGEGRDSLNPAPAPEQAGAGQLAAPPLAKAPILAWPQPLSVTADAALGAVPESAEESAGAVPPAARVSEGRGSAFSPPAGSGEAGSADAARLIQGGMALVEAQKTSERTAADALSSASASALPGLTGAESLRGMAALSHAGTLPAGQAAPSMAFIAQIGQAVAGSASAVTELRLTPEELGLVRIELQTEGEKVSVTLIAERAETLDLLRRHSERLISELRNAGFSQLDLGFGNHRDGQAGAYNAAPLLHQGRPIADLPTDLPAEMAAPLPAWPASVDGSSLYMRL